MVKCLTGLYPEQTMTSYNILVTIPILLAGTSALAIIAYSYQDTLITTAEDSITYPIEDNA